MGAPLYEATHSYSYDKGQISEFNKLKNSLGHTNKATIRYIINTIGGGLC